MKDLGRTSEKYRFSTLVWNPGPPAQQASILTTKPQLPTYIAKDNFELLTRKSLWIVKEGFKSEELNSILFTAYRKTKLRSIFKALKNI